MRWLESLDEFFDRSPLWLTAIIVAAWFSVTLLGCLVVTWAFTP